MTLEQAPGDMVFEMNFESDTSLGPGTTSYDLGDIGQSDSPTPSPLCHSDLVCNMDSDRNCVQCFHVNSSAEGSARSKHFVSGSCHYYSRCRYHHQGYRYPFAELSCSLCQDTGATWSVSPATEVNLKFSDIDVT